MGCGVSKASTVSNTTSPTAAGGAISSKQPVTIVTGKQSVAKSAPLNPVKPTSTTVSVAKSSTKSSSTPQSKPIAANTSSNAPSVKRESAAVGTAPQKTVMVPTPAVTVALIEPNSSPLPVSEVLKLAKTGQPPITPFEKPSDELNTSEPKNLPSSDIVPKVNDEHSQSPNKQTHVEKIDFAQIQESTKLKSKSKEQVQKPIHEDMQEKFTTPLATTTTHTSEPTPLNASSKSPSSVVHKSAFSIIAPIIAASTPEGKIVNHKDMAYQGTNSNDAFDTSAPVLGDEEEVPEWTILPAGEIPPEVDQSLIKKEYLVEEIEKRIAEEEAIKKKERFEHEASLKRRMTAADVEIEVDSMLDSIIVNSRKTKSIKKEDNFTENNVKDKVVSSDNLGQSSSKVDLIAEAKKSHADLPKLESEQTAKVSSFCEEKTVKETEIELEQISESQSKSMSGKSEAKVEENAIETSTSNILPPCEIDAENNSTKHFDEDKRENDQAQDIQDLNSAVATGLKSNTKNSSPDIVGSVKGSNAYLPTATVHEPSPLHNEVAGLSGSLKSLNGEAEHSNRSQIGLDSSHTNEIIAFDPAVNNTAESAADVELILQTNQGIDTLPSNTKRSVTNIQLIGVSNSISNIQAFESSRGSKSNIYGGIQHKVIPKTESEVNIHSLIKDESGVVATNSIKGSFVNVKSEFQQKDSVLNSTKGSVVDITALIDPVKISDHQHDKPAPVVADSFKGSKADLKDTIYPADEQKAHPASKANLHDETHHPITSDVATVKDIVQGYITPESILNINSKTSHETEAAVSAETNARDVNESELVSKKNANHEIAPIAASVVEGSTFEIEQGTSTQETVANLPTASVKGSNINIANATSVKGSDADIQAENFFEAAPPCLQDVNIKDSVANFSTASVKHSIANIAQSASLKESTANIYAEKHQIPGVEGSTANIAQNFSMKGSIADIRAEKHQISGSIKGSTANIGQKVSMKGSVANIHAKKHQVEGSVKSSTVNITEDTNGKASTVDIREEKHQAAGSVKGSTANIIQETRVKESIADIQAENNQAKPVAEPTKDSIVNTTQGTSVKGSVANIFAEKYHITDTIAGSTKSSATNIAQATDNDVQDALMKSSVVNLSTASVNILQDANVKGSVANLKTIHDKDFDTAREKNNSQFASVKGSIANVHSKTNHDAAQITKRDKGSTNIFTDSVTNLQKELHYENGPIAASEKNTAKSASLANILAETEPVGSVSKIAQNAKVKESNTNINAKTHQEVPLVATSDESSTFNIAKVKDSAPDVHQQINPDVTSFGANSIKVSIANAHSESIPAANNSDPNFAEQLHELDLQIDIKHSNANIYAETKTSHETHGIKDSMINIRNDVNTEASIANSHVENILPLASVKGSVSKIHQAGSVKGSTTNIQGSNANITQTHKDSIPNIHAVPVVEGVKGSIGNISQFYEISDAENVKSSQVKLHNVENHENGKNSYSELHQDPAAHKSAAVSLKNSDLNLAYKSSTTSIKEISQSSDSTSHELQAQKADTASVKGSQRNIAESHVKSSNSTAVLHANVTATGVHEHSPLANEIAGVLGSSSVPGSVKGSLGQVNIEHNHEHAPLESASLKDVSIKGSLQNVGNVKSSTAHIATTKGSISALTKTGNSVKASIQNVASIKASNANVLEALKGSTASVAKHDEGVNLKNVKASKTEGHTLINQSQLKLGSNKTSTSNIKSSTSNVAVSKVQSVSVIPSSNKNHADKSHENGSSNYVEHQTDSEHMVKSSNQEESQTIQTKSTNEIFE